MRRLLLPVLLMGSLFSHPAAFVHPGLLNSKADLDFVKIKVGKGESPWKQGYDRLLSDMAAKNQYGASEPWISRAPHPHKEFKCTEHEVPGPQTDLWNDVHAVYGHALLYYLNGKEENAKRATAIIDAWSNTLQISSGSVLCPSYLWPTMIWGAEILRSSYPGWPKANQDKFKRMLNEIVWKHIDGVSGNNSNWGAWQIACQMTIAVFSDDKGKFDIAVDRYKKHLLRTIPKDYGKAQETCRDLHHTQMGLAPLAMCCEIAWKQGVDLYSLNDNRLLKGCEYNGTLVSGGKVAVDPGCKLNDVGKIWYFYYAIQNHYVHRMGINSPIIDKLSSGSQSAQRTPWLSLTHKFLPGGSKAGTTYLLQEQMSRGSEGILGKSNYSVAMNGPAGNAAVAVYNVSGRLVSKQSSQRGILIISGRNGITPLSRMQNAGQLNIIINK